MIGAGPAGLSAGLTARSLGLEVMVLEQARLAESIRAFPRGKLVLDGRDTARDLPGRRRTRSARSTSPSATRTSSGGAGSAPCERRISGVIEQHRVVSLARETTLELGFTLDVESESGERRALSARRVIVAVGQRGSPRRLDAEVPLEAQGKVHYFLSDARTFAGRRTVVVGLGDTAMEAAIALAAQPESAVTVVYRGPSFKRGKRRNLERLQRLEAQGKVRLRWSSEIECVGAGAPHTPRDPGGTHRRRTRIPALRRYCSC